MDVRARDGQYRRLTGLIDTGADFSTFPDSYAAELGVDLGALEAKDIDGVCGTCESRRSDEGFTARVAGLPDEETVDLTVACQFLEKLPVIIWGRHDVLVHYDVQFCESQQLFKIGLAGVILASG